MQSVPFRADDITRCSIFSDLKPPHLLMKIKCKAYKLCNTALAFRKVAHTFTEASVKLLSLIHI